MQERKELLNLAFNDNSLNMKLNRIKVVLAEKEKTNKWLAEQVGRSEVSVSRWCTNEMQPSLGTLAAIAEALEVDIRELINATKQNL